MSLREAYQEKVSAQLCEWLAWIEQVKSGSSFSQSRGLAERQRSIAHLEDCYQAAQLRLEELTSAQEERWELAKQAVERAMIDLKRALDEHGLGGSGRIIRLLTSRSRASYPFQRKG